MTRQKVYGLIFQASPSNDEMFQKIISALLDNKIMTEEDLAHTFSVSLPTVRRWKKGETAPHPLMRKSMYDKLLRDYLSLKK